MAFWSVNRAHQSDIGGSTHGAYNPGATRDLAGGHPHHAAQALRRRRAARRRAADDHDERAPPARLHGRPARDDRLRARRRAAAARAGRGLRRQDGDRRGGRDPRRRRAPGPRVRARRGRTASTAARAILDDDGHGVTDISIRATVTKKGDGLVVDLSDSAPQVTGFVNSAFPNTMSAVHMALRVPHRPAHAEELGHVPAGDGDRQAGHDRVPEPAGAGDARPRTTARRRSPRRSSRRWRRRAPIARIAGWGRRFRIAIKGVNPRTKRPFIWHMFHARPGGGATRGRRRLGDRGRGAGGRRHQVRQRRGRGGALPADLRAPRVPRRLRRRRHVIAAASARCCGCGSTSRSRPSPTRPATASATRRTACSAAATGCRIATGCSRGGRTRVLQAPRRSASRCRPGDVFLVESSGGGGYGPPAQRPREARDRDRANGVVTRGGRRG